jgi:carbamoyltransferase
VAHHDAHTASAYYTSPWRDDVLALSLDGAGDGLCATVNIGQDGVLRQISRTTSENSLGYIYGVVADLIGMQPHEVMTSAPPNSYALLKWYTRSAALMSYEILKTYIGLDGLQFKKGFAGQIHEVRNLARRDLRAFFPHALDIAAGLQRLTEELVVEWVTRAMEKTGLGRITAAGGVFLNTRANERIRALPGVEGLFIPQNPGDESTSIGAAYQPCRRRTFK